MLRLIVIFRGVRWRDSICFYGTVIFGKFFPGNPVEGQQMLI